MTMHISDKSHNILQSQNDDPIIPCSKPRDKRLYLWGRGRISAYTRSLPRFSSFNPDTDNDVGVPASKFVVEGASASLTSNTDNAQWNEKLKTTIDINEQPTNFEDKSGTRRRIPAELDNNYDDNDSESECFPSKLRKSIMRCFLQNHTVDESVNSCKYEDEREKDSDAGDQCFIQIECILGNKDSKNTDHSTSSSLKVKTSHPLCTNKVIPPSEWKQKPLLLVATPGRSDMIIRKIRRSSEISYFENSDSNCSDVSDNNVTTQLPINNGTEHPSHVHVIDFETKLFAGTALFRIRGCNSWRSERAIEDDHLSAHDYFAKQNRKFQMVIRGKFKSKICMADCLSGLLLDHRLITSSGMNCVDAVPCSDESVTSENCTESPKVKRKKCARKDSLPSKLALRTAVKVAGVFSPRMDADLECASPRILSPLCSTAQTINVFRNNTTGCTSPRLEASHSEPFFHSNSSLVSDLKQTTIKHPAAASTNSVQYRKSAFDRVYDSHANFTDEASPCFDQDAEYTFEFLQHLIDYNDLSLDCGKVIGKVKLGGALRGQPVRFVSVVKRGKADNLSPECSPNIDMFGCLWSFDLWHESLAPNRQ